MAVRNVERQELTGGSIWVVASTGFSPQMKTNRQLGP